MILAILRLKIAIIIPRRIRVHTPLRPLFLLNLMQFGQIPNNIGLINILMLLIIMMISQYQIPLNLPIIQILMIFLMTPLMF